MDYEEISGETLTPSREKEVKEGFCTNCFGKYKRNRNIMVARLKYKTLWWHSPNSGACVEGARGRC